MLLLIQVVLLALATTLTRSPNPFIVVAIIYGISFLAGILFGITPTTLRMGFVADYIIIGSMIAFILDRPKSS